MNMPQGQGNLDAMKAEMIFVADLFNKYVSFNNCKQWVMRCESNIEII